MSAGIVIVGGGFAAQQLVRTLRKRDGEVPIRLVTADSGDEYSKPDLSHVVSRASSSAAMVRLRGCEFAEQQRIVLQPHCRVEAIDRERACLRTPQGEIPYGQLVLATGARARRPDVPGSELMVTLNSLAEYAAVETRLARARRVLVLGAGLIGCELAMDLASAGREVTLVDLAPSLLPSLLPAPLVQPLQQALLDAGVTLRLGQGIARLDTHGEGVLATLTGGETSEQGLAIAAIGLRPNIELAAAAGLEVGRGIRVDALLRTSDPRIFALGDGAQWQDQCLPFLQPIVLGANALAGTLLGHPTALALPPMLVKVKTPGYPLQLAGRTLGEDLRWQIEWDCRGLQARAEDGAGQVCGFVVGGDRMSAAFPLLRELPR